MEQHGHAHDVRGDNRQRMAIALAVNVVLLAAAVVGGFAFGSLALLADAGHVLSDVGAIAIGLLAARMAARPAAGRRTFGFLRGEILAALANGVGLVVVAALIFIEAVGRLSDPPDVEAVGVIAIGAVGLAGNVLATWILAGGDRSDVNLEGVLRHSAADAVGSLGAVASGVVILTTDWLHADPLAGILIGLLVLASSRRLLREPLDVLMEAAPRGVDVEEIGQAMAGVAGVREVHDLHVWTVTSGFPALAAHVMTDPAEDVDEVRRRVEALLVERYGIEHTTLQAMAEPLLELEDRRPRP